jgi:hypothetical protein
MGGGAGKRFSEVIATLKQYDIEAHEPTGGGSHWKLTKSGFRPYTIPAGNGPRTMVDGKYLGALCRHFKLDKSLFRSNS